MLFLSDGRPSDRTDERELSHCLHMALERVHEAFVRSHTHLESFQLLGFGEADETVRHAGVPPTFPRLCGLWLVPCLA